MTTMRDRIDALNRQRTRADLDVLTAAVKHSPTASMELSRAISELRELRQAVEDRNALIESLLQDTPP